MTQQVEQNKGILVHCPNKICNYQWLYRGRFFIYATCPCCRRNLKIANNKVEAPQPPQVPARKAAAFEVVSTGVDTT